MAAPRQGERGSKSAQRDPRLAGPSPLHSRRGEAAALSARARRSRLAAKRAGSADGGLTVASREGRTRPMDGLLDDGAADVITALFSHAPSQAGCGVVLS